MQNEHSHIGTRASRGERLPVRPYPEHGVGGARVVLSDDCDPHG
jgi:hypothetical protein